MASKRKAAALDRSTTKPELKINLDLVKKLKLTLKLRPWNTRAGFMDLPGEIRNRIYGLCSDATDEPFRLYLPPHQGSDSDDLPDERQFLGLTQVSRQIRLEYLPIYRRQQNVCIPYQDLPEYLSTFVTTPGAQDGQVIGRICLDIDSTFKIDPEKPKTVDVLPLLRLYQKSHALGLEVLCSWETDQEELQEVLDIKKAGIQHGDGNDQWIRFMNRNLSQIVLRGGWGLGSAVRLDFVGNPKFKQAWRNYEPYAWLIDGWVVADGDITSGSRWQAGQGMVDKQKAWWREQSGLYFPTLAYVVRV